MAEASAAGGDGDEIQGVELAQVRTGDDARRRGWFWHWNSIVTQYAPLIGLKGVGLLNSYTVWTDRRESSPLRGYAFPSQQSEADFYGEERAELIAINKILVALDLIEIKKEMVLRVDEQGHRWRVPHNLYRVKDTDEGRGLTTRDVLNVVALAERDAAVYRHLRRVFSARFAPIDPANVWHAILPEVREDAGWQRLAAKTAREEERFSARSKAGHASRRAAAEITPISQDVTAGDTVVAATGTDAVRAPAGGDTPTAETTVNDTVVVVWGDRARVDVAGSNGGSTPAVGPSYRGCGGSSTSVGATAVGPSNRGRPSGVAPSNTIEDQSTTTTTTTLRARAKDGDNTDEPFPPAASTDHLVRTDRPVTADPELVTGVVTTGDPTLSQGVATPPQPAADAESMPTPTGGQPADDRRRQDEALALTAFEAANGGRVATPAEVQILRQLAGQLDPAAAGDPELATGWAWVGAAIYEAVDAGSAYVAPRRIREIAARWRREGRPGAERSGRRERDATPPGIPAAMLPAAADRPPLGDGGPAADPTTDGGPDVAGRQGLSLWEAVVRELARTVEPGWLGELTVGVAVARVTSEEVELVAPVTVARALGGEYRPLLTRALSVVLRRTVRLTIRPVEVTESSRSTLADPGPVSPAEPAAPPTGLAPRPSPLAPTGHAGALGLTDAHLWAAVVDEVVREGAVGGANAAAWLRTARIAGRTAAGGYVVAAASEAARRRLDVQLRPALEAALARVLGPGHDLEVVTIAASRRTD